MVPKLKIWVLLSILTTILGLIATTYSFQHDIKIKTPKETPKINFEDPQAEPKIDFKNLQVQQESDSICNINEKFSCDTVAQDSWSTIFGIPLGYYGFSYFVAGIVLLTLGYLIHTRVSAFAYSYLLMNIVAFLISMTLFLYSKFGIGVFCPSCIAIDSVVALQLFLSIICRKAFPTRSSLKGVVLGGIVASSAVVVTLGMYFVFFPSL